MVNHLLAKIDGDTAENGPNVANILTNVAQNLPDLAKCGKPTGRKGAACCKCSFLKIRVEKWQG